MKKHLLDLLPEEFSEITELTGERPYRIKQILEWIYRNYICDFSEMTSLSLTLRNALTQHFDLFLPDIIRVVRSKDGSQKFLLKLHDNQLIEMVFMPGEKKNTLCISSQVGCARQCSFCATAGLGLVRNLEVHELVAQVLTAIREFPDKKLTNIVLMGMGEPMDNYDNVIKFIKIMQHEQGLSFSPRRMTLSTSGIVPGILRLADESLKIKLAVSLNACINSKRDELMPINKLYPLKELKQSLIEFRNKTAFRITFEYIMIKNFNMGDEDIKALRQFTGDLSCKINLIQWNRVEGLPWVSPTDKDVQHFKQALESLSVAITLRQSRGNDISAACGQLVAKTQ